MPLTRASPAVGCSRSATIRIKVVLPQPEGPTSETNSPAWTCRLIALNAWIGASAARKVRLRLLMEMTTSPATRSPGSKLSADRGRSATRTPPSDGIRAFHYGTKQHVATSSTVLLGGVLDLVMADPILAGDEDHGG